MKKDRHWIWLEPEGLTPEEQAAIRANNQALEDKVWERNEAAYRRTGVDEATLAKCRRHRVQADARLYHITLKTDGTLVNPRGYPEEIVRHAIEYKGKQGARTRKSRREKRVHEIAEQLAREGKIGDPIRRRASKLLMELGEKPVCCICDRALTDQESIDRLIGPECWQDVLNWIEKIKTKAAA